MFVRDWSRLSERAANTSLTTPPQSDVSQQFDKVHDAFGPGAFFAWVLTAYSVMSQYFSPLEGPLYWNLDKDLAASLLYPTIVAGQLIYKVNRYPGPRSELWSSTYRGVQMPEAAPIWASAQVCVTASGMNIFFLVVLRKSRIRFFLVAVASTWILIALCYSWVPSQNVAGVLLGVFLILLMGALFLLSPFCPYMASYLLLSMIGGIHRTYYDYRRFPADNVGTIFAVTAAIIVLALAVIGAALCLSIPFFYFFFCPESNHSIKDFGQLIPLLVALLNILLALRTLIQKYWRKWWQSAFKLIEVKSPAAYAKLPSGETGESLPFP